MSDHTNGILLGGFVLAHSAWIVSDLGDGELLCPFAVTITGENQEMHHFEAESQEEAIRAGKQAMEQASGTADAWALSRESLVEGKDALTVTFWAKGMPQAATLLQRYKRDPKTRAFTFDGKLDVILHDRIVPPEDAAPIVEAVRAGMSQHPEAGELFQV